MEPGDPLPRLLRLRGVVEQSVEDPATIDAFSADGLRDSYGRLRGQARALAVDVGVGEGEFDDLFPEHVEAEGGNPVAIAKAAANLLRQLDGHLGGLCRNRPSSIRSRSRSSSWLARQRANPRASARAPSARLLGSLGFPQLDQAAHRHLQGLGHANHRDPRWGGDA